MSEISLDDLPIQTIDCADVFAESTDIDEGEADLFVEAASPRTESPANVRCLSNPDVYRAEVRGDTLPSSDCPPGRDR
jgi:hypothetical protein